MFSWLLAAALSLSASVKDIDGVERRPLAAPAGKLAATFFITTDCPIANAYAPEVQRICRENPSIQCHLVYVDPRTSDAGARAHAAEYGHTGYPLIVDRRQDIVRAAGATVTPEVVLVKGSSIVYRGRIDNRFAGWGKKRRVPTEFDLRDAITAILAGREAPKAAAPAIGCYIADFTAIRGLE